MAYEPIMILSAVGIYMVTGFLCGQRHHQLPDASL